MTTLLAIWLIPMSICLILLFTRSIPEEEIGSLSDIRVMVTMTLIPIVNMLITFVFIVLAISNNIKAIYDN